MCKSFCAFVLGAVPVLSSLKTGFPWLAGFKLSLQLRMTLNCWPFSHFSSADVTGMHYHAWLTNNCFQTKIQWEVWYCIFMRLYKVCINKCQLDSSVCFCGQSVKIHSFWNIWRKSDFKQIHSWETTKSSLSFSDNYGHNFLFLSLTSNLTKSSFLKVAGWN